MNNEPQTNWPTDISIIHEKFGVHEWLRANQHNKELLRSYLAFRLGMIYEELGETQKAAMVDKDPEEIVDGLIDICVFAVGTLDVFGVDANKAWNRVHQANMAKEPGQKAERANAFGLPDMIKPEGWTSPSHEDNHGQLPLVFSESNND
jgi:predicted HAD superfamily Cof-like phosphohydrolase